MNLQSTSMRHEPFFTVDISFLAEFVVTDIKYEAMFPNCKLENKL